VLGHYLMDHHANAGATGVLTDMLGAPSVNGPNRPNGIYVIRFRNTLTGPQEKGFIRGYGYQGGGGTGYPAFWSPGFGEAYKKAVLEPHPAYLSLGGFGETLARFENSIEIDPDGRVDAWGIPVLRVNMTFGDNERAMAKDMASSAADMLEAAGAKFVTPNLDPNPVPGWGIHEVGTARMGTDPKTSVLNAFCQTHDVKNLFVMDGSSFVSIGCQNPTLTIMAIAVRSTDYLLDEMKKGNI
jgi:choline dehydrogenase-like flavoprotein